MKLVEISDLKDVAWLSNCGGPLPSFELPAIRAASWREADVSCSSKEWQRTTEEAAGDVTSHLTLKHPSRYQGVWNKLVRELRPKIEAAIVPTLLEVQAQEKFSDQVVACIKYDVLLAVMTSHYADCKPPIFFLKLFEVYRSGHFPCGWEGDWPAGILKIF